jgi:hypothetical protein
MYECRKYSGINGTSNSIKIGATPAVATEALLHKSKRYTHSTIIAGCHKSARLWTKTLLPSLEYTIIMLERSRLLRSIGDLVTAAPARVGTRDCHGDVNDQSCAK